MCYPVLNGLPFSAFRRKCVPLRVSRLIENKPVVTIVDAFCWPALSADYPLFPVFPRNVHQRAPHEPARERLNQGRRPLQDYVPATHRGIIISKPCPYAVQHGNIRSHNQVPAQNQEVSKNGQSCPNCESSPA